MARAAVSAGRELRPGSGHCRPPDVSTPGRATLPATIRPVKNFSPQSRFRRRGGERKNIPSTVRVTSPATELFRPGGQAPLKSVFSPIGLGWGASGHGIGDGFYSGGNPAICRLGRSRRYRPFGVEPGRDGGRYRQDGWAGRLRRPSPFPSNLLSTCPRRSDGLQLRRQPPGDHILKKYKRPLRRPGQPSGRAGWRFPRPFNSR